MPSILDSILRAGEGKILRQLKRISEQINSIEDEFVAMSDAELRAMTGEFRQRLEDGETLDDILPEAFATVREAARRTLGQRAFDVQLMGGAALHLGNISEMRTGEGKTLTGVFPAYLNALAGKGVHVVTTNDYLAKRDSEWMGRVHRFLGLEVGAILAEMTPPERQQAYAADVTYGTNNEFGFDYLRDNMAWSIDECVQRGHNFAIVDEVDSILVDEARTPLIISGPAEQNSRWYTEFAKIAPRLRRGEDGDGDYDVDEKKRTVGITESGVEKVEDWLGIDNLYDPVNTPLVSFLNNALKAKELFKKDKDYVVVNGEVLIVDEFTGRMLHGRRYNEGMHQAIEAKEGVQIQNENQTFATITLQNYFRLYDKLAGMTGTALTEANEFMQIYKLGVVQIPTNRPMVRADETDVIYQTQQAKFDSVVEDIVERREAGQPVLVGTVSVEKSEILSVMLKRRGVPHHVLNAKYHEQEATIIAQSGRLGAVTVATNMAGRGTDIMLGGNPEFIADAELHQRGLSPVDTPEDYEAAWPEAVAKAKAAVAAEHEEVVQAGGLYVLGTERHESRRIDNQLRGRSGRQGDPGKSRFYLSLEDDLMRMFNSERVGAIMDRLNIPADVPVENSVVSRAIRSAQTQVESQNFEIRKDVLKYDDVLNRQRTVIYGERHEVLEGADLHEQVRSMIDEVTASYVTAATADGYPEEWDLEKLWKAFKQLFPITLTIDEVIEEAGGEKGNLTADLLIEMVQENAQARLRPARGGVHAGADAPDRAARRAVGARPEVARAPVRDGLPPRGHRPAGDGAARPAGGVPARGLRHVQRDDGRDQGRVGREPVQPAVRDPGEPDRRGGRRRGSARVRRRPARRHRRPDARRSGDRCARGGGARRSGDRCARRPRRGQKAATACRPAEHSRARRAACGLRQAGSRQRRQNPACGRPAAGSAAGRSRSRQARRERRQGPRHGGGPGPGGHPQRRDAGGGRARSGRAGGDRAAAGRPGHRTASGRAGRTRAAPSAPAPVLGPGRRRRRGAAR